MPKRQHKSGVFDPDYRRKGWNTSGFAPKNSSMSISQLAFGVAALVFFSQYLFPQTRPYMMTWDGLLPRAILAIVLWLALGLLLRRVVWMRFRGMVDPKPLPKKDGMFLSDTQTDIHAQTAREFEERVAWVISSLTNHRAVVVGGAGDRGVDIKVYDRERLVGIVQCKKYDMASPLPPMFIRELYGAKQHFGVSRAYLVTTTTFTKESELLAKEFGIELMDRDEFARNEIRARRTVIEREKQLSQPNSEG